MVSCPTVQQCRNHAPHPGQPVKGLIKNGLMRRRAGCSQDLTDKPAGIGNITRRVLLFIMPYQKSRQRAGNFSPAYFLEEVFSAQGQQGFNPGPVDRMARPPPAKTGKQFPPLQRQVQRVGMDRRAPAPEPLPCCICGEKRFEPGQDWCHAKKYDTRERLASRPWEKAMRWLVKPATPKPFSPPTQKGPFPQGSAMPEEDCQPKTQPPKSGRAWSNPFPPLSRLACQTSRPGPAPFHESFVKPNQTPFFTLSLGSGLSNQSAHLPLALPPPEAPSQPRLPEPPDFVPASPWCAPMTFLRGDQSSPFTSDRSGQHGPAILPNPGPGDAQQH